MLYSGAVAVAAMASVAMAAPNNIPQLHKLAPTSTASAASPTASDDSDVYAAQATALTLSPTSHIPGRAFNRYVSIWFENTDYDMAAMDENFKFFAEKGITLTNQFAVTHPSEPNYMAAVGGDYFGLDGDPFTQVPQNVSSVVDLLEERGISWGMYQEDMPYSGYQGFDWVNQETGDNDYVRKHNPEILYNNVVTNANRAAKIKNTTMFYEDLNANKLPQWMFITPNMTSDGHDTSVTVAGTWLRGFLEPLLSNKNFMQDTLVLITFDENETYEIQNNIFGVLLGDSVPSSLVGTSDASYYNHYSEIATVEANWDLFTLGRYDVGANVFSHVAAKTGDKVRAWNGAVAFDDMFFNLSYPGIFNSETYAVQPQPNVQAVVNGRVVLPSVVQQWYKTQSKNYYNGSVVTADGYHPPPS